MAILPSYLSLFFAGTHSLAVIRALRLLRVFRVLKLVHFVGEARMLRAALRASSRKIIVFLGAVLTTVLIVGSRHVFDRGSREPGFTSIPTSVYWTIVTMTTVGYGDIAPQTPLGKLLASVVMIMGLWHHRGADGHRHRRNVGCQAAAGEHSGVSRLCQRGP